MRLQLADGRIGLRVLITTGVFQTVLLTSAMAWKRWK
jgi:hypothetical protein